MDKIQENIINIDEKNDNIFFTNNSNYRKFRNNKRKEDFKERNNGINFSLS